MPPKRKEFEFAARRGQPDAQHTAPIMISGRWMIMALTMVVFAAVVCAWGTLCLLFWQGAWQLLYRPASVVARTPAAAELDFSPVTFPATDPGQAHLHGWWIPEKHRPAGSHSQRYTVVYLHGAAGNLADCIDELAAIHESGVDILAFDYRGYGQSQFVHPSEAHWREDADWAISYAESDRKIPAQSVILVGNGLGANLALEVAAAHPELGGVVLDSPLASPADTVFKDARARLVPARLLFHDRYEMMSPAQALQIPSLWIVAKKSPSGASGEKQVLAAYGAVSAPKTLAQLSDDAARQPAISAELRRWLPVLRQER